jgi:hypothetical protein
VGGGDWAFSWGKQEDDESIAAIHTALDAGVNWIDTAAVYGAIRMRIFVAWAAQEKIADWEHVNGQSGMQTVEKLVNTSVRLMLNPERREPMNSTHSDRKQKVKHELWEMTWLFLYLAFFFCAFVGYDLLLLKQYEVAYWNFGFALLNALVITKVIMIGEYAKLGKRHEDQSLLVSTLWKAFVFGVLVFAFHIVEEIVKRLIHGTDLARASREVRLDQLASRTIVVFCTFIPLFAFREFRRVMGEEPFHALVFGKKKAANENNSSEAARGI